MRQVSSSSFSPYKLIKLYQNICTRASTCRLKIMAPKTTQPSLRIPVAPKKKPNKCRRPAVTASRKSLQFLPRLPSAPVKRQQKKQRPHEMLVATSSASNKVRKCLLWDLVFSQYSPLRSYDDGSPMRCSSPPSHMAAPVKQRMSCLPASVLCKKQLQF